MPAPTPHDLVDLAQGRHKAPFDVLGPHPSGKDHWLLHVLRPDAKTLTVEFAGKSIPMQALPQQGLFVAKLPCRERPADYLLKVTCSAGGTETADDPYRFPPLLSDAELESLSRGEDLSLHERLGAHACEIEGVAGVRFAVWAPNGLRVSVIGSFNGWDERRHPMRPRGSSGIWEIFLPGVADGALYKYDILTRLGGRCTVKADPCGRAMELRPETASIVVGDSKWIWKDKSWMRQRAERQAPDRPISIYEVHLGSWRRRNGEWLSYLELADELVPYVKEMGFTHIELMPVTEHPFDGSWGYQTVGYFSPTARHGSPDDLRALIDAAHRAGLGVILDWVPAHFPRDGHGLGFFDGTHLYEHADPRRGLHRDWGTFIYNYGKSQVTAFLLSSALYWLGEFHIDGLRVDAVASMLYLDYSREPGDWLPNERGGRENLEAIAFLQQLNDEVHKQFPGVLTFAEESTAWPGVTAPTAKDGLGFDYKWNMGWMNDTLSYHGMDPLLRGKHQNLVTFPLTYAFSEHFLLPLSHDEVVHGKASLLAKLPGEREQAFANLRALYGWMITHPGKKLLFMGAEIGPWTEWNHESELEWGLLEHDPHKQVQAWLSALVKLYVKEPALHQIDDGWDGFQWIDCSDAQRSVVACIRRGKDVKSWIVIVANFTPVPWEQYRIGVPAASAYRVLLNGDAVEFGGKGNKLPKLIKVKDKPAAAHDQSIVIDLPPMTVLFLKPRLSRSPRKTTTRTPKS